MRAFSKYRAILKGDEDLRKEVKLLDSKLNDVFKYLLDKIDALHHKQSSEKPESIGYKIKDK